MKRTDWIIFLLGIVALLGINVDNLDRVSRVQDPQTRHEMVRELSRQAARP